MEDLIKVYYDEVSKPIFFTDSKKILWSNKAAQDFLQSKIFVKKILGLKYPNREFDESFISEGKRYKANVKPFKDCFYVEVLEDHCNPESILRKYYDGLTTPVFLCRGNNIIWHNVAAVELFSNKRIKQNILKFKNFEKEGKETFICGDFFYKVLIRPFEDSFYVEIFEQSPVGFNAKKETIPATNEILQSEILDTIARNVVHDVSQALTQISEILEKNNDFSGLKFVDIILKRMYSFMRATNLCYEYEVLLKETDNINAEVVDIFVEIDALCSAVKSLISKSDISFEWVVPDDKIFCDIDMHKLSFALFHVICNSYSFSIPGSEIKVFARIDDNNNINIDVCDKGIGIPRNILDKVLKPFFSYDSFSGDIAGVGLGLTYAGLFVNKVNGMIKIDSTKNGTKVSLSIPIVPLSDVMGLSSHIVRYGDSKYDNMIATLIGNFNDQKLKI